MCEAGSPVRSAQAWPLVARIVMGRPRPPARRTRKLTSNAKHCDLEVTGSRDYRHIVGARDRASWPTCRRLSGDVSPLVAASRILEAPWVRAPVW